MQPHENPTRRRSRQDELLKEVQMTINELNDESPEYFPLFIEDKIIKSYLDAFETRTLKQLNHIPNAALVTKAMTNLLTATLILSDRKCSPDHLEIELKQATKNVAGNLDARRHLVPEYVKSHIQSTKQPTALKALKIFTICAALDQTEAVIDNSPDLPAVEQKELYIQTLGGILLAEELQPLFAHCSKNAARNKSTASNKMIIQLKKEMEEMEKMEAARYNGVLASPTRTAYATQTTDDSDSEDEYFDFS